MEQLSIGAEVGVEQRLLVAGLAFDLARFFEQFDENRHFRTQDDRVDRLEHIIDGAHRIAPQLMLGFLVHRRQEDDRDALGLIAAADDLGGFIAVHPRHVDVEQDDRELTLEQVAERFLARACENHFAQILEDGRDGEQVALVVVDQKHARPIDSKLGRRLQPGRQRDRDFSDRTVHAYSAASSETGTSSAAFASRARATHTRNSASRSSMSTGLAI